MSRFRTSAHEWSRKLHKANYGPATRRKQRRDLRDEYTIPIERVVGARDEKGGGR